NRVAERKSLCGTTPADLAFDVEAEAQPNLVDPAAVTRGGELRRLGARQQQSQAESGEREKDEPASHERDGARRTLSLAMNSKAMPPTKDSAPRTGGTGTCREAALPARG